MDKKQMETENKSVNSKNPIKNYGERGYSGTVKCSCSIIDTCCDILFIVILC